MDREAKQPRKKREYKGSIEDQPQCAVIAVEEDTTSFGLETVEVEATRRAVSPKVVQKERFAVLAANGTPPEKAGQAVGISVATAYRWLQDKDVAESINKTKQLVKASGQRKIQRLQTAAIDVVKDIMLNSADDRTKLAAALAIIDRSGLSVAELMADNGVASAPVVVQQFLQLNNNSADRQAARAAMESKAIEGIVTEAQPSDEEAQRFLNKFAAAEDADEDAFWGGR